MILLKDILRLPLIEWEKEPKVDKITVTYCNQDNDPLKNSGLEVSQKILNEWAAHAFFVSRPIPEPKISGNLKKTSLLSHPVVPILSPCMFYLVQRWKKRSKPRFIIAALKISLNRVGQSKKK